MCMRADTLALLLGAANTRAGITSIVVDHVGGMNWPLPAFGPRVIVLSTDLYTNK